MSSIDKMKKDGTFDTLSKREKLHVERMREKLEKNLGSIADMSRLPGALFVVDTLREHIAVKEAQKLNIPIFAMVDPIMSIVQYKWCRDDEEDNTLQQITSH